MLIILAIVGIALFLAFVLFIISLCVSAGLPAPRPDAKPESQSDGDSLRRLKTSRLPGDARRAG
jgi:hypothetical protein